MSLKAFLSVVLYEAGVCKWLTEQTVNRKCMFYFVILRSMSTNSLHLCLRLLCRLLLRCKPLSKYAARSRSANLHLMQPWMQEETSLTNKIKRVRTVFSMF